MSAQWKPYKDIIESLGFKDAAIIVSKDGKSVYTPAPYGGATPAELQALATTFSKENAFFEKGIVLGGKKYMTVRHDSEFAVGKKGSEAAIVIGATNKTLVIGVCGSSTNVNDALSHLGKRVIDYLKSTGY